MRVEWSKSRARAERWHEEIILLPEEMRRVLAYFDWKSKWWLAQRDCRVFVRPAVRHGMVAYAEKQAALFRSMGKAFARQWEPLLTKHNIPIQWPEDYIPAHVQQSQS